MRTIFERNNGKDRRWFIDSRVNRQREEIRRHYRTRDDDQGDPFSFADLPEESQRLYDSPALRTHGGFLPPPKGDRLLILAKNRAELSNHLCKDAYVKVCVQTRRRIWQHSRSAFLTRAPCFRLDYASQSTVWRKVQAEVARRTLKRRHQFPVRATRQIRELIVSPSTLTFRIFLSLNDKSFASDY